MITEEQVPNPNGLCFSPDHRKLYVVSSGRRNVCVFAVGADNRLTEMQTFTDCLVDGVRCGPDGVRTDVYGNVWISSNAGRRVGYSGVTVWSPEGQLLGRIRIPEAVANITFGGPKRNRLFIAASQSIYALYVNTQGAAPA